MLSPLSTAAPLLNMSTTKKQIPLRLSMKLFQEIAAWAEDDFRSINGQIEYLLTEAVRQRRKTENQDKTKQG